MQARQRTPWRAVAPALALSCALVAGPVSGQMVRGIVVGAGDGQPIGDAQLVLRNEGGVVVATASSSADGRFALGLRAAGRVSLEVSHLGYRSWETAPFDIGPDAVIDVEVQLGIDAIPLEPITVVAQSTLSLGSLSAFRQRMADPSLDGYFIEEEEISRRPVAKPSDLVLGRPGMTTAPASSASGMDRGVIMAGGCPARTFIDGAPVRQGAGASIDDLLTPDRIAGIEIYPRGLGAPLQYQDSSQPRCGVVLFWTKPAEPDADRGRSTGRLLLGLGLLAGILTLAFLG
jgi:hypothetical protein